MKILTRDKSSTIEGAPKRAKTRGRNIIAWICRTGFLSGLGIYLLSLIIPSQEDGSEIDQNVPEITNSWPEPEAFLNTPPSYYTNNN